MPDSRSSETGMAYPIKLDDERSYHGIDANGDVATFGDYLYDGDRVGPSADDDGGEAMFVDAEVVARADGLWVVAHTHCSECLRRMNPDPPSPGANNHRRGCMRSGYAPNITEDAARVARGNDHA